MPKYCRECSPSPSISLSLSLALSLSLYSISLLSLPNILRVPTKRSRGLVHHVPPKAYFAGHPVFQQLRLSNRSCSHAFRNLPLCQAVESALGALLCDFQLELRESTWHTAFVLNLCHSWSCGSVLRATLALTSCDVELRNCGSALRKLRIST